MPPGVHLASGCRAPCITSGLTLTLDPMQGLLLAAIGSRTHLLAWALRDDGTRDLAEHCTHYAGNVLALYVDTRDDYILVGGRPPPLPLCVSGTRDWQQAAQWHLGTPLQAPVPMQGASGHLHRARLRPTLARPSVCRAALRIRALHWAPPRKGVQWPGPVQGTS